MRELTYQTKADAVHGGRVYEAARRWRIGTEEVLDFSANINPLGPPPMVLAVVANASGGAMVQSYPETNLFVDAIADRYQLVDENIVVGNGVAALLFAALRALAPKKVAILEPAFGEYRRACIAASAEVISFQLNEDDGYSPDFHRLLQAIESREFDLVIINNPHNPSGTLYPKQDLLGLVERASSSKVALIVDEAFIDYVPDASLLSEAAVEQQLIVLRSLTKFYAMPGLRVGYAVCNPMLADLFRAQIDAWPVSAVALEAGRVALTALDFEARTRQTNIKGREEFSAALAGVGLKVFPAAANFLLVKLPNQLGRDLELWLESAHVLIRRCDSFRGLNDSYVRLAVRNREDNLQLVALIQKWLSQYH